MITGVCCLRLIKENTLAVKNGPTIVICDKCGKKEEFERAYHTVGWVDVSVDQPPNEERDYNYDEYNFCSWGCARDFADDMHGKLEF
jgi:hypothetical protein